MLHGWVDGWVLRREEEKRGEGGGEGEGEDGAQARSNEASWPACLATPTSSFTFSLLHDSSSVLAQVNTVARCEIVTAPAESDGKASSACNPFSRFFRFLYIATLLPRIKKVLFSLHRSVHPPWFFV